MRTYFMPLSIGVIGALILVIFGIFTQETILFAFALATLSVGFGIGSLTLALEIDRRITTIDLTLTRIATIQEEIKKTQEEQPSSNKPLLATLQGLSQYYMDYITKQKTEDEQTEEK